MKRVTGWATVGFLMCLGLRTAPARAETGHGAQLSVTPVEREAKARAVVPESELAALRAAIAESPKLRKPRFDLVHALVRSGKWEEARKEAAEWRLHDAYSLVAVRQLGDIESELGDKAAARRTYSAIVELLPKDVEARRAVATIMKQAGDYEGSRLQLMSALELRGDDRRTEFELGDVEQRLGMVENAKQRFESTARAKDVTESLRYPAKQRLSQIYAAERRQAAAEGRSAKVSALTQAIEELKIHGGVENDIKVYLSWDTDRTDIDLWMITPSHEKIFYQHKVGAHGETLLDDVTSGYGPESFTANHALPGEYLVQVNFFGASGAFKEARGEVIVVLNEGRPSETSHTFPYRIFDEKGTVTVATIHVTSSTGEKQ